MTGVRIHVERVTYTGDDPDADPDAVHDVFDVPWGRSTLADVYADSRFQGARRGPIVREHDLGGGIRTRETVTVHDNI